MIISASRRTDICAFHTEWFMNRLDAGYVMVRNPVYRNSVTRVPLTPKDVDHMAFVTKDPSPIIPYLLSLKESYSLSFQITVTPYGEDLEPNVPPVDEALKSFMEVSGILGKERVVWRFDPIVFLRDRYGPEEVLESFKDMCQQLNGFTDRCIFTFLDYYRKLDVALGDMDVDMAIDKRELVTAMLDIADSNGITLSSCCESDPQVRSMIARRACFDPMSMRMWGVPYAMPKVPVRKGCDCVRMVDIGEYDTCMHDCRYCYANSPSVSSRRKRIYDPESEFICGYSEPDDVVQDMGSSHQTTLF